MYLHNSPREFIIPALFPPLGVTPNFKNPESRGSEVIITSVICLTLMTLFVCMRFYTKIHIKRVVTWDDCECWCLALGLLVLIKQDLCIPAVVKATHHVRKIIVAFTNPV